MKLLFLTFEKSLVLLLAALLLGGCAEAISDLANFGKRTFADKPEQVQEYGINGLETSAFVEGIRIIPFEGIPGNKRDLLIKLIMKYGGEYGINFINHPDSKAYYLLRGKLIATGDDENVFLVYDITIADQKIGLVVNRMSGQEIASGVRSDPWSGVSSKELDTIARRVAASLDAWFSDQVNVKQDKSDE